MGGVDGDQILADFPRRKLAQPLFTIGRIAALSQIIAPACNKGSGLGKTGCVDRFRERFRGLLGIYIEIGRKLGFARSTGFACHDTSACTPFRVMLGDLSHITGQL